MWKHYFIFSFRNLRKRKFFSIINILGLSIGIATFLILSNYANYEFSYDKYFPQADRVYRIDYYEYQNNEAVLKNARTHTGLSTWITHKVPEVSYVAKAYYENCLLFNDKAKGHQKGLWADSTFLKIFNIQVLSGNRDKALVASNSMAISRSLAEVYFGNDDPIGKILYFNEHVPFTITAVFEDIPANASVRFSFLVSMTTLFRMVPSLKPEGDFGDPWTFTYILLNQNVRDTKAINLKLERLANENVTSLRERNLKGKYELRPLRQIHFTQGMTGELEPGRSKMLLYALISIAVFILFAGWMNYINLSLAQSFQRAEEITVRKIYGASVSGITQQFIAEAIVISLLTVFAGTLIYFIFVKFLSAYLSADFEVTQQVNFKWLFYLPAVFLFTLLASIFPARIIARYKPAFILKRQFIIRSNKNYIRNGLVVFQLLLSILTIGCALIAGKQINYMMQFDVGFNTMQTISLHGPASRNIDSLRYQRFKAFRSDLLSNNKFIAGTASMNIPGEELRYHDESIRRPGGNNDKKQTFWISLIDDGYLDTYGLQLVSGRNLVESDKTNGGCLINESAARALGYSDPAKAVNAVFLAGNNKSRKVTGVIRDFHHESLRKKVEPVVFYFDHPYEFGYYSFRVNAHDRAAALDVLQQTWKKHYPDDPFIYYFMDTFFARQYANDEMFGKLLGLFSIMSIVVACLGLFGLASLSVVRRTKEIGIRKVVGASAFRILILLSRDYLELVCIAFLIVLPVFYYVMREWLNVFSYKIKLQWWMFLLPGIIVLLLAWLVVSVRSVRAALANPVKSLRTE